MANMHFQSWLCRVLCGLLFSKAISAAPVASSTTTIAHRGFASEVAENTMAAVHQARKVGAGIIEVDVRLLQDGALVIFHDGEVKKRRLRALSLGELQEITPGIDVPVLGDLLDWLASVRQVKLLLDLKETDDPFTTELVREIARHPGVHARLQLQSRSWALLQHLARKLPDISRVYLTDLDYEGASRRPPDAQPLADRLVAENLDGVSCKGRQFIDRAFVQTFQNRGLHFNVWTINPPDRLTYYLGLGVDGIITDRPDVLESLRKP